MESDERIATKARMMKSAASKLRIVAYFIDDLGEMPKLTKTGQPHSICTESPKE